jgi:hypothetical protein
MGDAPAGNPEEGVRFLFRATPKPKPGGSLFARKPTAKQVAGHSGDRPPDPETLRKDPPRLHHILIQGNLCAS